MKQVVWVNNPDYLRQTKVQKWLFDLATGFVNASKYPGFTPAGILTYIVTNFARQYFRLWLALDDNKEPVGFMTAEEASVPFTPGDAIHVTFLYMKPEQEQSAALFGRQFKEEIDKFKDVVGARFITFRGRNPKTAAKFAKILGLSTEPVGYYYVGEEENGRSSSTEN